MRLKRFAITDFLFLHILKDKEFHIRNLTPLPDDAEIVRMGPDVINTAILWVIISSESFKELKNGDIIPLIELEFEKLNYEKTN